MGLKHNISLESKEVKKSNVLLFFWLNMFLAVKNAYLIQFFLKNSIFFETFLQYSTTLCTI